MKLICSKASLLKGVSIVSKAVPSRTTMPILNCILIDASANEIKLTANDMELGIETVIEGEIVERGIIALDAKFFSEIVRKLPDNDVVIESDDTFQTTITCEKAKFNIVGKSGEDFSYLPYIEKNESISISQFTLKDVILHPRTYPNFNVVISVFSRWINSLFLFVSSNSRLHFSNIS